mmetsp:Transcript_23424/g.47881  ORF Transcript_23424/g.47881 Transcript_23424/m.47881 type:complete len:112 (+) Transcript_23424:142-477(+)
MKLSAPTILAVALSNNYCHAFTTSLNTRNSVVSLTAANTDHTENENTGVVSRRTAAAAMFISASASLVAAPMVSVADTSLDFALPSYDTKMSGFGEGNESYIKKRQDWKCR